MVGKEDGHLSFRVAKVWLLSLTITLAALCAIPVYGMDCTIDYNTCKIKAESTCRLDAGACSTFKAGCETSFQTCNVTEQNRKLSIDKIRKATK